MKQETWEAWDKALTKIQMSDGIFDHKWLDQNCVVNGCQSLVLKQQLATEMLDKMNMLEGKPKLDIVDDPTWQALKAWLKLRRNTKCNTSDTQKTDQKLS